MDNTETYSFPLPDPSSGGKSPAGGDLLAQALGWYPYAIGATGQSPAFPVGHPASAVALAFASP